MSHDVSPEPTSPATDYAEWRGRRRLADVFGDVLPDTTSDEREPGSVGQGTDADGEAGDRWLREQVPPHHG
jgi:hypothetical protein